MPSQKPAGGEADTALHEQESASSGSAVREMGHPSEADATVDDLLVERQQWFRQLVDRWKKHHEVSLQLRYDTGSDVNLKIGPPDGPRQPRGMGVVETLAVAIGVDMGEISRMRWFAHRVESLKAFCRENPNIRTWDAVKVWLAQEASRERGEDTSSQQETNRLDRFAKSLRAAMKALPAAEGVGEEEVEDLRYELRKFGRALKKFGLAITVTESNETAAFEREQAGASS